MVEIKVRGGDFPPGSSCNFRDDHFRFNEGVITSASETIYVGTAIAARVIERCDESTSKPEGRAIVGGAGAGALAGAWFSPFSAGVSIAVGAVLGAVAARAASMVTTPGHVTFEMLFTDKRLLVGTVDISAWDDIQEAWRISAHATPRDSIGIEAVQSKDSLTSVPHSPIEANTGLGEWIRWITPWKR
jgi:hypothetical protein